MAGVDQVHEPFCVSGDLQSDIQAFAWFDRAGIGESPSQSVHLSQMDVDGINDLPMHSASWPSDC
ncbi:hypothetical protein [Actinoplanes cyaneus]|uniref:hypothetical protein n=1 Tax=Actinoplanes cyaneus TaxID=52696 RepID=UPI00194280F1|nr:hypothetical protein [Actinoplanes cyaneus]